jgi:predicted O-methyltransferase YrrM
MAGAPDFLAFICKYVLKHAPSVILEAGSGFSTVYIAACMKTLGTGTLISLEHEEQFTTVTKKLIKQLQLESFVSLHVAPLRLFSIGNKKWFWYDFESSLNNITQIDLMIVDGPPQKKQPMCRYPAMPLIRNKFVKGSRLILDDVRRSDEQKIIQRWKKEFDIALEIFEHERGTCLITVS